MNPRIKEAIRMNDYKLKLSFTKEEQGTANCSQLLDFRLQRDS